MAMIYSQHNRKNPILKTVADYQGGKVSVQVARIIQGYTDYVRRTVWRER